MSFGKKADVKAFEVSEEEVEKTSTREVKGLEFGHNLFWLLPPMRASAYPWRALAYHYNPMHVCGLQRAQRKDTATGVVKVNDRNWKNCPRCLLNWEENGYDKNLMDRDTWRKSERYERFKKNRSSDKVVAITFPLDPLFTQETRAGKLKMVLRKDAQKIWADIQKQYCQFVKTDKFLENKAKGAFIAMPYVLDDENYLVGIQTSLFSWQSWHERADIESKLRDLIADGITPWGTGDNEVVPYVLDVEKTGNPKEYTSVSYKMDMKEIGAAKLSLSDEFLQVLIDHTPDVEEVMLPPTKEEMLETMRQWSSGSSEKVDMRNAPECFGNEAIYNPTSEECYTCSYRSNCGKTIRDGSTPVDSDEEEIVAKPVKKGFAKKEEVFDEDIDEDALNNYSSFDEDDNDDEDDIVL